MPSHPETMRTTRSDRTIVGVDGEQMREYRDGGRTPVVHRVPCEMHLLFPMLNLDATRLVYCFYISIGIFFSVFVTDTTPYWHHTDRTSLQQSLMLTMSPSNSSTDTFPEFQAFSFLLLCFFVLSITLIHLLRDVFWIGLRSENGDNVNEIQKKEKFQGHHKSC